MYSLLYDFSKLILATDFYIYFRYDLLAFVDRLECLVIYSPNLLDEENSDAFHSSKIAINRSYNKHNEENKMIFFLEYCS